MEVKYGRGYVYTIQYHIVWCVKYRRKVLSPEIGKTLFSILEEYAAGNGFSIEEYEFMEDHVHLLVSATPQVRITDMMRGMKGVSARKLFLRFPALKEKLWGGHMWNPSYFVATVSDQTESQIRDYIRSQKER